MYFVRSTVNPALFFDVHANDWTLNTGERTGYETEEEALELLYTVPTTKAEVVWIP